MRRALVLSVLAVSAPAHADRLEEASWIDLGLLGARFELGDGRVADGEMVRFGPRFSLGRFVYLGGEADFGKVSTGPLSVSDVVARGAPAMSADPLSGPLGSVKLLAGIHALFGPISGAAELAPGMHHFALATALGNQYADVDPRTLTLQGHARVDLWVAPTLSIGAIYSFDLLARENVSFGVMLGFHFEPYDVMRGRL